MRKIFFLSATETGAAESRWSTFILSSMVTGRSTEDTAVGGAVEGGGATRPRNTRYNTNAARRNAATIAARMIAFFFDDSMVYGCTSRKRVMVKLHVADPDAP